MLKDEKRRVGWAPLRDRAPNAFRREHPTRMVFLMPDIKSSRQARLKPRRPEVGQLLRTLSPVLVFLLSAGVSAAGVEKVTVTQVMNDNVVITRANGESYLIEVGVGCLSLWRYEGRTVLVNSRGLFLGVGSTLVIPELGQNCRIWSSEALEASSAFPVSAYPNPLPLPSRGTLEINGVELIQRALRRLGYAPGPPDGKLGQRTLTAIASYQTSKGLPFTEEGVALTLYSLPLDLLGKRPGDPEAFQVAAALSSFLLGGSSTARSGGATGTCLEGLWIASVTAMGELITLGDGSVWEVDIRDKLRTMRWLPGSLVSLCGNHMINNINGQAAKVTRLR